MEEEKKNPFIKDSTMGILGCVNGILLYDLLWPYITIFLFQLILFNKYATIYDNHYYTLSLALMIVSSLFTLVAGILLAKPKNLLSAYKKPKSGDTSFILKSLGVMFLFSYVYNFILLIAGVDIAGGNANQNNVIELIQNNKLLSFFSMVIMAPILEEITYRYFLFGTIANYNRKWAIVISGFIFMCVHGIASFTQDVDSIFRELLLLPPYMFSGMVLANAYNEKENLLVPTLIHSLNNLISFMICLI